MPWLSIIMALLSFFLAGGQKKENRTRALAAAAVAGLGTYYVSHETEWGQKTLGDLDGVVTAGAGATTLLDANGDPITVDGTPVKAPTTGVWDTLTSWGPDGVAKVVGVTGVTAGALTGNKSLLLIGAAALAVVLLMK